MPAQDRIHGPVKNALIKDGWTITAEPFTILFEDASLFADLAAEKALARGEGKRIVVVEIKSFVGPSPFTQLESALGQYQLYRGFLEELRPECEVWLAIGKDTYVDFFERKAVQFIVSRYQIALVVVDTTAEEIVQWIS